MNQPSFWNTQTLSHWIANDIDKKRVGFNSIFFIYSFHIYKKIDYTSIRKEEKKKKDKHFHRLQIGDRNELIMTF